MNRVDSLPLNTKIPASTAYTIRYVAGNAVNIPNLGDFAFGAGGGNPNGDTPFESDLGVTKLYSTLTPLTIVGSTGTFTITARNNGPRTSFQVQYQDVLPPTRAFAASPAPVATAGTFATSGNTGTWTISAILPLTSQTLSFTVMRISKTNNIATLTARITTSYTVTVSNIGPYTATSASLRDPVATGLSCTAATCSAAINATCPVAASVTVAALQSAAD